MTLTKCRVNSMHPSSFSKLCLSNWCPSSRSGTHKMNAIQVVLNFMVFRIPWAFKTFSELSKHTVNVFLVCFFIEFIIFSLVHMPLSNQWKWKRLTKKPIQLLKRHRLYILGFIEPISAHINPQSIQWCSICPNSDFPIRLTTA